MTHFNKPFIGFMILILLNWLCLYFFQITRFLLKSNRTCANLEHMDISIIFCLVCIIVIVTRCLVGSLLQFVRSDIELLDGGWVISCYHIRRKAAHCYHFQEAFGTRKHQETHKDIPGKQHKQKQ